MKTLCIAVIVCVESDAILAGSVGRATTVKILQMHKKDRDRTQSKGDNQTLGAALTAGS